MFYKYKIDWLSFTISAKIVDVTNRLLKKLNYDINEFDNVPGRYFYNSGLTLSGYVNIYYNDKSKEVYKNSSDTVNFVFTGQGCSDLYSRVSGNLNYILNTISGFDAKVTRLDIALDDFEGILNLDLIEDKLKNGHYRSSKKTYNVNHGKDVDVSNKTIYVGSKRNNSSAGSYYLRIYDKKAQYISKNQILPDYVVQSGIWQRYEISYSKGKADYIFHRLVDGVPIGVLYKQTMKNAIEFLIPSKDKNKSRWKVCKWWKDFIDIQDKIDFGDHERDVMLNDLLEWIKKSVLPSLKLLELLFNERNIDIYDVIKNIYFDNDKFSKKQLRLLNNSRSLPQDEINNILQSFKK